MCIYTFTLCCLCVLMSGWKTKAKGGSAHSWEQWRGATWQKRKPGCLVKVTVMTWPPRGVLIGVITDEQPDINRLFLFADLFHSSNALSSEIHRSRKLGPEHWYPFAAVAWMQHVSWNVSKCEAKCINFYSVAGEHKTNTSRGPCICSKGCYFKKWSCQMCMASLRLSSMFASSCQCLTVGIRTPIYGIFICTI